MTEQKTSILFALETIKTSQGWFEPAHLLPQHDLPEQETTELVEAGKAARFPYDHWLAAELHELRKLPNKSQAEQKLKDLLARAKQEELSDLDDDIVIDEPPSTPGTENVENPGSQETKSEGQPPTATE